MPAVIKDTVATDAGRGIEQTQRVVDMSDAILNLWPEETPLTVLLSKLNKQSCYNPKFEWLEDEPVPWVATYTGATETTQGTSLTVNDGNLFAPNDLVKVFRTGEVFRVTAVSGNTLTVTRNWDGGATNRLLQNNDALFILGDAQPEGAPVPQSRVTKKTPRFNFTEIFRTPVKITGTLEASRLYGGNERAYQRAKMGREHRMKIERALWFGTRAELLTGDTPVRSTGGVFYFLSTNKTTLANESAFTKAEFDKFLESVFAYGSDERWVFASPRLLTLINGFADSALRVLTFEVGRLRDRVYGIQITRYQGAHGVVNLVRTPLFKDYRTSGGVAGKVLVALDFDRDAAAYRYLQGRDTQLRIDVVRDGTDASVDEYLSECGLQLGLEQRHGILEING